MKSIKSTFPIFILLILIACNEAPYQDSKDSMKQDIPERDFETLFKSMNITLPTLGVPQANYVHSVRTGNLIFTAGKGPRDGDGKSITGKLGADLSVEEGYEAAKWVGVQQLAALKQELGDLNKVKRIVKVLGMVNCTADFKDQSKVINGFSDLMVQVFGDSGKHARSAVGMAALPNNIAVEIEMIVEVY